MTTHAAIGPLPTVAGSLALWDRPRLLPSPAQPAEKTPHLARALNRMRRRALADALWAGVFLGGLTAFVSIVAAL